MRNAENETRKEKAMKQIIIEKVGKGSDVRLVLVVDGKWIRDFGTDAFVEANGHAESIIRGLQAAGHSISFRNWSNGEAQTIVATF